MRSKRSVQAVIKALVIIFHKIFLSGCYERLHAQWPVINGVSFAVLMSYNSLKARLPLQCQQKDAFSASCSGQKPPSV